MHICDVQCINKSYNAQSYVVGTNHGCIVSGSMCGCNTYILYMVAPAGCHDYKCLEWYVGDIPLKVP